MAKKINVQELIDAKREREGIEFDLGGETFTLDAPELWPDDVVALAEAGNNVGFCKAIMGDDYDRFTKAGGSQGVLGMILQSAVGVGLGK